jgi:Bacterial PH domain
MTIPRQLGPETGLRTALPDYSRSNATVERMVSELHGRSGRADAGAARRSGRKVRALFPVAATRDTLLRSVVAALALGGALVLAVVIVLLWLTIEDGRSPGILLLLVILALAAAAVLVALLGLRFAVVALGTARSRVEITDEGLRVVGALSTRQVPWDRISEIESRVVHPVHWLTAALRLRDGSRVVMPAFDRHVWTYSQPSGQDIRTLRTELHRREQAGKRTR